MYGVVYGDHASRVGYKLLFYGVSVPAILKVRTINHLRANPSPMPIIINALVNLPLDAALYNVASARRRPSCLVNTSHINCPSASSSGITKQLLDSVESSENIALRVNPVPSSEDHSGIGNPSYNFSTTAVAIIAQAEMTRHDTSKNNGVQSSDIVWDNHEQDGGLESGASRTSGRVVSSGVLATGAVRRDRTESEGANDSSISTSEKSCM